MARQRGHFASQRYGSTIKEPFSKNKYNPTWQDRFEGFLISGGTDGRTKTAITVFMRPYITAEYIDSQLELWYTAGKVQKFTVPSAHGGSRPVTVWRATTKMLGK